MWVCSSILRFCISTAKAASGFYLGLEVELPWVVRDGLNDTSKCTLSLMLSMFERRSVSFCALAATP